MSVIRAGVKDTPSPCKSIDNCNNSVYCYSQDYLQNHNSFNPFTPLGFPIDKRSCLALDRVKSMSVCGTYGSERVNC